MDDAVGFANVPERSRWGLILTGLTKGPELRVCMLPRNLHPSQRLSQKQVNEIWQVFVLFFTYSYTSPFPAPLAQTNKRLKKSGQLLD